MHIGRAPLLIFLSAIIGIGSLVAASPSVRAQNTGAQNQQQLVESVNIVGNRRNRTEDLLYWVQTKPQEPYNAEQVQRDLQALLALGFFEKSSARVEVTPGERGVIVTFYVTELPIIRDLQFEGLHSVPESDVLKAFRERRVGVSKEAIYDPVKVNNAIRVLKELLAAHGHPNATIETRRDEVSQTSIAITFVVHEGERVRVVEIQFEGNQIFSDGKLRSQMKLVREAGLITRFRGQDILDREKLDFDLRRVTFYMRSKGYLQARTGEPRIEGLGPRRTGFPILPLPFLSSTDEALRVTVPVTEGKLYRIGSIKVEGNSIYSEQVITNIIGLKPGDIANGERISKALNEDLKKAYGSQGFIQYEYDVEPAFKDNPANPKEGLVDFVFTITEGKQFQLRRLEFVGNTFTRDYVLRREVLVNEGDVYNQRAWEVSILRLNQLGFFNPIDKDKDADFRTDEEQAQVDITLKVSERGRQQISFNGGISGIGGSFFGLNYSTNNLFGRGETLSFDLAYGNRQRSFQFSFTEPYLRNRPITVGFSVFTYSQKFFGEGTFLSQNTTAQAALLGTEADVLSVSDENLFTRNSTGISIFASSPLSEFMKKSQFTQLSRIGLSYQISQTSVKDPAVNQDPNNPNFIPVIYGQPNILSSRITGSYAYDTRAFAKDPNDPVRGKSIAASVALTGLGGDVRTYSPQISYTQYIPVRRKGRDEQPEVFAFRIVAANIGSFATSAKVRNAASLAFINGIPIYERFFLGDEFTIRGYNVRSISPIVPLDTFISSRNVVLATNATGTPVSAGLPAAFTNLGVFTGPTGSNTVQLPRSFTAVGGDTQLLGNFEYHIPIFGPVSLAAYADLGSSFNLRSGADQTFSSNFLSADTFLQTLGTIPCRGSVAGVSLNTLAACNNNSPLALAQLTGGLIARDNRLITQEEYLNALNVGPVDPISGLPVGMQQVFLRGEAQTNTVVRLSQGFFSKFTDYRSSIGLELRFQVPIINVPFRLIYAYNPNARTNTTLGGIPFFFGEKRSVFRFSVGRTF